MKFYRLKESLGTKRSVFQCSFFETTS